MRRRRGQPPQRHDSQPILARGSTVPGDPRAPGLRRVLLGLWQALVMVLRHRAEHRAVAGSIAAEFRGQPGQRGPAGARTGANALVGLVWIDPASSVRCWPA
jgi:hypothetical protein